MDNNKIKDIIRKALDTDIKSFEELNMAISEAMFEELRPSNDAKVELSQFDFERASFRALQSIYGNDLLDRCDYLLAMFADYAARLSEIIFGTDDDDDEEEK